MQPATVFSNGSLRYLRAIRSGVFVQFAALRFVPLDVFAAIHDASASLNFESGVPPTFGMCLILARYEKVTPGRRDHFVPV